MGKGEREGRAVRLIERTFSQIGHCVFLGLMREPLLSL